MCKGVKHFLFQESKNILIKIDCKGAIIPILKGVTMSTGTPF